MTGSISFKEKYGKWAVIVGGSEGLGGAYTSQAAERGMSVVVIGRREAVIEKKRREVEETFGVETKGFVCDLTEMGAWERIAEFTKDIYGDVGMLVYNAAFGSHMNCWERTMEEEDRRINCNIRNNLGIQLHFLTGMKARGRGALVWVSSMTGTLGSPFTLTYSASKAWINSMAEGMWGELDGSGVDVLTALVGPTIGQQFKEIKPGTPGYMTGDEVATITYEALGKGPHALAITRERLAMASSYFNAEARKNAIVYQGEYLKSLFKANKEDPNTKLAIHIDMDNVPTSDDMRDV